MEYVRDYRNSITKKISYEIFTMTCWIEEGKAAGGKSRLLRIKYLSEFFKFYKTGVLMS